MDDREKVIERLQNCKHGYHSDHWEIGIYRIYKDDWFCADGRRRE